MGKPIISIALALALLPSVASAQCDRPQYDTVGKYKIALLPGKLFFRADALALDFDGSPIAYGVKDQGQENICVGLAPNSGTCKGKYNGACYATCQQTFAAWSRSNGQVQNIGATMCSVGLGGGGCSVPNVRLQELPQSDYFVSETSLKASPDRSPRPSGWTAKQQAQLDPALIRYIVAPTSLAKYGIHYGDVGVAYNAANKAQIAFIVGDCCGLGEASVSLLAALRPEDPPRLTDHTSALGQPVKRYASGISGDFRFVIYRGSGSLVPGHALTTISASVLPDWIDRTAKATPKQASPAEILACTAALKPTPTLRKGAK